MLPLSLGALLPQHGHARPPEPIGSVVDAVARHGFGGIAPWRRDLEGRSVEAVARQVRDAGLAVSSYCRSTYLPAGSREQFDRNVEDNRVGDRPGGGARRGGRS